MTAAVTAVLTPAVTKAATARRPALENRGRPSAAKAPPQEQPMKKTDRYHRQEPPQRTSGSTVHRPKPTAPLSSQYEYEHHRPTHQPHHPHHCSAAPQRHGGGTRQRFISAATPRTCRPHSRSRRHQPQAKRPTAGRRQHGSTTPIDRAPRALDLSRPRPPQAEGLLGVRPRTTALPRRPRDAKTPQPRWVEGFCLVGPTGFEPVASSLSGRSRGSVNVGQRPLRLGRSFTEVRR